MNHSMLHRLAGVLILFLLLPSFSGGFAQNRIHVIDMYSVISPVSAKYVDYSIDRASRNDALCLIIRLDTPGGLMTSMKEIIKRIMNADIPVVIYIAPSGAQAVSAGVFITLSAHFAAMAPGTNIGAAHPVMMGSGMGGTPDSSQQAIMNEKVTNDAIAYIRTIAEERDRNADWAEESVRNSVSVTEKEALELGIIDTVAVSVDALIAYLNGKSCEINQNRVVLNTEDTETVFIETPLQYRILDVLSHPNVAYILLILGFYGLFFELSNPGSILPGVLGGIFLILAFFSLQILPVNFAGVALIILGIILFILEVKVTSFGMLTLGGVISMILGSMMLFESPEAPAHLFQVSLHVIIPVAIFTALFTIVALTLAYRAHKLKVTTGAEGIVGEEGIVKQELNPDGKVLVHGETWNATSQKHLPAGTRIVVEKVDRMTLTVKPMDRDNKEVK